MPLPVSGAISFNNINVELGVAGTTQASLGQASYRTLAGVASGAISMSNFYGKANQFAFTISSNQTNANLRTLALNAGWNGASNVVATIGSGIQITSTSTGTPALTISGSFPGGVSLTNNGFIIGRGGNGGGGGSGYSSGANGGGGGTALSVSSPVSINNAGTIGGGGGGGGGSLGLYSGNQAPGGGGGAGFGAAGACNGCGGRPMDRNSSAGGLTTAGLGGLYGNERGGNGGGLGASGGQGTGEQNGYDPGYTTGASSGGSGGSAVTGNSNITWTAFGTRTGAIS
jgi:hypothetical protein